jgi:hypothetical protein
MIPAGLFYTLSKAMFSSYCCNIFVTDKSPPAYSAIANLAVDTYHKMVLSL